MIWSSEANGMLSDKGYFITHARLSRGFWYNAYAPKNRGIPIASGQLERCLQACERHCAGEIYAKTKRQLRAGSIRPSEHNAPRLALSAN